MGVQKNGMLFVASEVAPQHEAEFNEWYDREHIEERARIAGFISSARYRSVDGGKPYLGLYRTESLESFTSAAYKAAFAKQTPWSVTNLNRMIDPIRRVASVEAVVGQGSGSYLAVLTLAAVSSPESLVSKMETIGQTLLKQVGVVQSYLLLPDTALSSPLPKERPENREMLPLAVIEGTSEKAIRDAMQCARALLDTPIQSQALYALLWKLYAAEIIS